MLHYFTLYYAMLRYFPDILRYITLLFRYITLFYVILKCFSSIVDSMIIYQHKVVLVVLTRLSRQLKRPFTGLLKAL